MNGTAYAQLPPTVVLLSDFDTTSISKASIGQESFSKPSISQVSHLVKYVDWSTSNRNTSFRQLLRNRAQMSQEPKIMCKY